MSTDLLPESVSVSTHLLERYWSALDDCARAGCQLCGREAKRLHRELDRRRQLAGASLPPRRRRKR